MLRESVTQEPIVEIEFSLPHVFEGRATDLDDARALRVLLDALIGLNLAFLQSHTVPTLYRSGVRYDRTVVWDTIPALYVRRYGDCKSLTAALIAQYRMAGVACEPVFRFVRNRDKTKDFHILVQSYSGFEDPSKILGMGKHENARFFGPDSF